MTDIAHAPSAMNVGNEWAEETPTFSVDETYWGYIVRMNGHPKLSTLIGQYLATFVGASLLAASLGLLLIPGLSSTSADFAMRVGAAIIFAAVAAFLLWFASRGAQTELQIDNNSGEVREVVRNRTGKTTLLGRYGFDAIGGVFIDRSASKSGDAALVLRYRNTPQTLPVATGPEKILEGLRDRLGQDLMLRSSGKPRTEHVMPKRIKTAA